MAQARPYRGVDAADRLAGRRRRLLEAGLELLGTPDGDPAELTVRAICAQAGLGLRYFYESFSDKDDFLAAVYDAVVADIAATTQAAVAAAPPDQQARAGMAN
ncbi:MAG: TetR/AcrR family transcriptional regulator, partial [Mycolicibacterium hassiacum]|nr:TetR/AcrR family transcriptional regulator [Mycolicibacterium hassiacum]